MEIEKELLQKAIDSILHGSTQIVSSQNSNGDIESHEIRINDLRVPLIEKLASKLVQTKEYKDALDRVFTQEVTKKIIDTMLQKVSWDNIPWEIKERLQREMREIKLEVRSYKLVAEVIDTTK